MGQTAPSQLDTVIGSKKVGVQIFDFYRYWWGIPRQFTCWHWLDKAVMARVKSALLVSAALRFADKELIDCVLVHRGDADAGTIFVHIDARDGRHQILARILDFDGGYDWRVITSSEWVDADAAKTRLDLELAQDPDAFVVEVSDPAARNPFLMF